MILKLKRILQNKPKSLSYEMWQIVGSIVWLTRQRW